MEINTVL